MTPYYSDDLVTLYLADCVDVLPELSADAIVTDPPYGMKWDGRVTSGPNSNSVSNAKSWSFGRTIAGDDQLFDPSRWLSYREVILWGANHYASALPRGTMLVWIKRNDDAFGSFLSDAEVAWMKGGHGIYCFRDVGYKTDEWRDHPTQKPETLMRWCVSQTSGVILDPYMGSGSTLVAAKRLGRKAVGIEIEERYCEIAANRLRQGSLSEMFQ